jgi:hypothetical protein
VAGIDRIYCCDISGGTDIPEDTFEDTDYDFITTE